MHTLENIFVKLLETSVSISYLTSNLHLTSSSIMLNDAGHLQRDLVLCSSLPEQFCKQNVPSGLCYIRGILYTTSVIYRFKLDN